MALPRPALSIAPHPVIPYPRHPAPVPIDVAHPIRARRVELRDGARQGEEGRAGALERVAELEAREELGVCCV